MCLAPTLPRCIRLLVTSAAFSVIASTFQDFNFLNDHAARADSNIELEAFDRNTVVKTAVGSGFVADSDGYGALAGLNTPFGVTIDSTEQYMYTTDFGGGGEVRRIQISSGYTKTIGISMKS